MCLSPSHLRRQAAQAARLALLLTTAAAAQPLTQAALPPFSCQSFIGNHACLFAANQFTRALPLELPQRFSLAKFSRADSTRPQAHALPSFPTPRSVSRPRLLLAGGALVTANWILYHQLNDAWWQEKRSGFHFYQGYRRTHGAYDLGWHDSYYYHLDKASHILAGLFLTESLLEINRWVGFSAAGAERVSAIVASALLLEVEIYDGFFEEWGFSLGDFLANELGVVWATAQRRTPGLRTVRLKISYDPRAPIAEDSWIKSYNAMTFWLSFPVRQWLPCAAQRVWPAWLNLAAGYGTDRLRHGRLEAYLALDVNGAALLASRSPYTWPLRLLLTYVHLPLPALQFKPALRFLPLQF